MFDFPYSKIFKQAISLVRNNRFVRTFGLFLLWGNVIDLWALLYKEAPTDSTQTQMIAVNNWLSSNQNFSIILGLIAAAIVTWLFVMYFRARAGIIFAVQAILKKQTTDASSSLRKGRDYSGRVAKIWLISSGVLLFCFLILSIPVLYLIYLGYAYRAIILAALAVLILVPIFLVSGMVNVLGVLFSVVYNMPYSEGLRAALDLIGKWWGILFMVSLAMLCITIAGFFLSVFATVLVITPFVFLAQIPYDIGGYGVEILFTTLGTIFGLGVFFWVMSLVSAFQHVSWTLIFLELVKPEKIEEEQPAVVPEAI